MGSTPTDRGKPGTKRHVITDRAGLPLATRLTGAHRHDSIVFEERIDGVPLIRTPTGRRRNRPAQRHADKVYDIPRCRQFLHRGRIKVRIARKGIDTSDRLGRHRWVGERTLAWRNRYRHLTIRDERRGDIHQGFLTLGCALICFRHLPSQDGL